MTTVDIEQFYNAQNKIKSMVNGMPQLMYSKGSDGLPENWLFTLEETQRIEVEIKILISRLQEMKP